MIASFFHPSLDELVAFRAGHLTDRARRRVANHLHACVRCQESLRFVGRLNEAADAGAPSAPRHILDRALASRAAGERFVLGTPDAVPSLSGSRRRWRAAAITGAAAAAIAAVLLVSGRTSELSAVMADSDLRITPAQPRVGETLRIVYRPMTGVFANERTLVLRARLRTSVDGMYSGGVPREQVRAVATLQRRDDGTYDGQFVLPDSVVFAALSVENDSAVRVDDNASRSWEVLTYAAADRPTFDALHQRANDMMGRSWEEAYASSVRLAKLYPDRYLAWTLREFFDEAMFGEAVADSLKKEYAGRLDSLAVALKSAQHVTHGEIGNLFYRSRAKIARGGTAADSADFRYWLARILREYPKHEQIAQYYAYHAVRNAGDPKWMLDSLEKLYVNLSPLRAQGTAVYNVAMSVVSKGSNDSLFRLWLERSLGGAADSAYRATLALSTRPTLRHEGEDALRRLLGAPAPTLVPRRALGETKAEYDRRVGDARRRALVALGRALVSDGRVREGIDTLGRAANGVWDLDILRSMRSGYLAAADSAAADRTLLRLAVDPRMSSDSATTIVAGLRTRLGPTKFDSLAKAARREMAERFLERSKVTTLRAAPHLQTASGSTVALRDVTNRRPAVVIFWSKDCGWAVLALTAITKVAEALQRRGTPVILVAGDRPSREISDYLADKKWTLPVYFDSHGEMKGAFTNFGTPQYYVLDAASRIRFDYVVEEAELIAQVDALRVEGE